MYVSLNNVGQKASESSYNKRNLDKEKQQISEISWLDGKPDIIFMA